jgi:formylglycine-generating enzyme required for sulfatase activity
VEYYTDDKTEKTKIFISYAHEDSEIAERLYKDLKREGFSLWLDKEDLLPGQNWRVAISIAMKKSSLFLALVSSNSLGNRGYAQKELKTALDILNEFPLDQAYLIPVYIEPCEPLDERLRDIHGIHLYESYERGIKKLVHALNYYAKNRQENKTASSVINEKERAEIKERIKSLLKNYDILSLDNTLRERTLKEKLNVQKLLGREYMKLKEYEKANQAFKNAQDLNQRIDELENEKSKKNIPDTSAEMQKPRSEQSLSIDILLAQAEAKKQREKELLLKLEHELEKYELLLKNHGMAYKDKAWQILCSVFPTFVKDVEPGDIRILRLKAGLMKPGDIWTEPKTDMEFVWVPKGSYMMGQTESEKQYLIKEAGEENYKEYCTDEVPRHEVCLDGFWMAKYEVTNKQYRKYKLTHNSKDYKGENLNGDEQPVVYVSWDDAKDFAKWLSQQSGQEFSLPTEAQWEYAARAGTETIRFWGDNPDEACKYANVYDKAAKDKFNFEWACHNCNNGYTVTSPVGSFLPNNFGLYDMLGNVWEWCEDVYDSDAYNKHERNNPVITTGGTGRVIRGGSWINFPRGVRAAYRFRWSPDDRGYDLGFRLCLSQVR